MSSRSDKPSPGSASPRPAVFPGLPGVGQRIAGKYEVERVLGAGGMGVVVAARHLQLGQRVAIKFLRREAALEPSAAERFLREARAAFTLTSEHATKVFDVGTLDSGEPYMVMEYLAGSDVSGVLRQHGPLGVQEAVDIVLQASEAIAEAHAHGIVHRDLKPSNLFVTKRMDGRSLVKVLDFGISKVTDETQGSSTLTASGSLMGSPAYMSPEQVRGAKSVDPRSDVWALGVILYELCTGKPPFLGESVGETFAKILSDSPSPVRELRPEVPAALAEIISRCLERDPGRRVQSVAGLASMLLPFAPSASALSDEPMQRAGRALPSEMPNEAMPAQFATLTLDADGGPLRTETNASWQRSGNAKLSRDRAMVGRWAVLGAGVVVAAAIGTYAWGRFHQAAVAPPIAAILAGDTTAPVAVEAPLPSSREAPTATTDEPVLPAIRPPDPAPVASARPLRKIPTPVQSAAPGARPAHSPPATSSPPPTPRYDQF